MAGARPVLIVTGRHRPHEIVLLIFSLMVGLAYTLGSPPPESVVATMPSWTVRLWAIGLLISGVVGIPAILLPLEPTLSMRLESAAMLLGAGALIVTTAAVFSYAGVTRGLFGGGFCGAWMIANLVRSAQIHRDLQSI